MGWGMECIKHICEERVMGKAAVEIDANDGVVRIPSDQHTVCWCALRLAGDMRLDIFYSTIHFLFLVQSIPSRLTAIELVLWKLNPMHIQRVHCACLLQHICWFLKRHNLALTRIIVFELRDQVSAEQNPGVVAKEDIAMPWQSKCPNAMRCYPSSLLTISFVMRSKEARRSRLNSLGHYEDASRRTN